MHHAVFGAAIPLLIALLVYARRRGRASFSLLIATPCGMVTGALWALAPDLPRILGGHALYTRLARDPRIDIFLWHYTIDKVDSPILDPLAPLFNTLFAGMIVLVLFIAWRELRLTERESGSAPRTLNFKQEEEKP